MLSPSQAAVERSKAFKARRRAAGLCVDCGTPSTARRCPEHAVSDAERSKARRLVKQEAGICVDCNEPAVGARCEKHKVKNADYQRARRLRLKAAGLCVSCGLIPPYSTWDKCADCQDYHNKCKARSDRKRRKREKLAQAAAGDVHSEGGG